MTTTPLAGHRVLFLMAVQAEYGPHLRARFSPVLTGVGPVEAGVVATATLAALQDADGLPDLVVSLGSAGSARLAHCGVYQARAIAYRDMDASPLGFARGVTPFLDAPAEIPLTHQIPISRRPACPRAGRSFRGRCMMRSRRIWLIWKVMPCCAPASASACP